MMKLFSPKNYQNGIFHFLSFLYKLRMLRKRPQLQLRLEALHMAASFGYSFRVHASLKDSALPQKINQLASSLSSTFQPFLIQLKRVPVRIEISKASQRLLDAIVDSAFQFLDQPRTQYQRNFAPVDEIGDLTRITDIEGELPFDFPEGVYIRNGSNPMFGALHSTVSALGRSRNIWVEGEGMLHAVYFAKDDDSGKCTISYKNRYIESDTFKIEKERNKPCFLPAIDGDSPAILASYFLNQLRFGKVNKYISNTNVFEHSGRLYSVAENHIPQEIDIHNLDTRSNWDVNGAWDRPFTAHPKKAPGSGELVIIGVDTKKPYLVLGVISADGRELKHKADLKLERTTLAHDIGITDKYNIILNMPLTIDINRLIKGGQLIKYEEESYSRIGVMPRYGDADSIKWFEIKRCCIFHLLNCFEDGDEVVVIGFRANTSVIPTPTVTKEKNTQVPNNYSSRLYEWRLNMENYSVNERYLTGPENSAEFPMVNDNFIGLENEYGYAQVVDNEATSLSELPKYGGLAKFYLKEQANRTSDEYINVEYHHFGGSEFCSGASFVPKHSSSDEDDGWIISYVHNEDTNVSQVHIIDTKRFESDAVVKITLPQRVPYGFHGAFFPKQQHRHVYMIEECSK